MEGYEKMCWIGVVRIKGWLLTTKVVMIACLLCGCKVSAQDTDDPREQAEDPLVVYYLDPISSQRVLPDCFPNVPGTTDGKLSLAACRGEYESASFAIYARQQLKNVQIELSNLYAGDDVLSKSSFQLYVVKCWYQAGRDVMFHDGVKRFVPELLLKDDALVKVDRENKTNSVRSTAKDGSTKYLPASGKDADSLAELRPVDADSLQPVTVLRKTLKQFWLTVHVPKDMAAGKYTGFLRLSADHIAPLEIPIQVVVHDFQLALPKIIYSIYYAGKLDANDPNGTIAAHYKSEEQMRAEFQDMLAHGVRYPDLWQKYSTELVSRVLKLRATAGLPNDMLFVNTPPGAPASAAGTVNGWRSLTSDFGYQDIYLYGLDEAHGTQLRIQKPVWENVQKAGGKMYASAWKEDPF